MAAITSSWHRPVFEDTSELQHDDIAAIVVGMIIIGVVSLAGVGYGAFCTAYGGEFDFSMNIQQGVKMSCKRK